MKRLTQNQILTVCEKLSEDIPSLLEYFEIESIEYLIDTLSHVQSTVATVQRAVVSLQMEIRLQETGDAGRINVSKTIKAIYLDLLEVYYHTEKVETYH